MTLPLFPPLRKWCRWAALMPLALWCFSLSLAQAQPAPAARVFFIDSAASFVKILLFRDGPFSGFAHDHVLVARKLAGRIMLHGRGPAQSTVRIVVPVAAIDVDLPEDRARENLSGAMSEGDRKDIRETMLGPDQLDEGKNPAIVATAQKIEGTLPDLTLWMKIRVKGRETVVPVRARVSLSGSTLRAEGEVELLQSRLGIEPFTFFLGAVGVKDLVRLRFYFQASERG